MNRRIVFMPPGYRALTSPNLPEDRVVVIDVDDAPAGAALEQAWADALDVAMVTAAAQLQHHAREGAN